jgi:hypothetical protein
MFRALRIEETELPVTTAADQRRQELRQQMFRGDAGNSAVTDVLARAQGTSPRKLTIAENGSPKAHIHVSDAEDVMTLNAAQELSTYLGKITGGDFSTYSTDVSTFTGPLLIVGRKNALTRGLVDEAAFNDLGEDGFIIESRGPHLVIAGATPRGTMYGVFWFLDRKLGIKWLDPTFTSVPSKPSITLGPFAERHRPRFAVREVLSVEGEDKRWRAHNLMNGESHGPSFRPTPPEYDSWDHSWAAGPGSVATFYDLLPPERYRDTHPEWYAGGQLAMMDPDMRSTMAAEVAQRLRDRPGLIGTWFGLHDMDWGWDMDQASAAFAAQHGRQPSAPRLDMARDVADRVRARLPESRFYMNAYHWSFTPPTGMSVPDHILIVPMTIQVDYSSPLYAGRNTKLGQDLVGWNKIARNVLVWDHITNFGGFIQPTPNLEQIGESIKWLAGLDHVIGYFAEGSWNTAGAEFAPLRAWMISRLLWDPTEDVRAVIAEFCRHYYGPAAGPINRYIDLMQAGIRQSGDRLGERAGPDLKMLTYDFVKEADQLFDEAEHLAANDPTVLAHVRTARIPLDYVALLRRQEYAETARSRNESWGSNQERLTRFMANIEVAGLTQFRQGASMEELRDLVAIERKPSRLPADVPSDSIAFQDLSFDLYDMARIVPDDMASDGAAAMLAGTSSGWVLQFKPYKLPASGEWRLFMSMRGDVPSGQDSEVCARVGSSPPMNRYSEVTCGDIAGKAYRLVEVSGGPFTFSDDHQQGIYVQLAANAVDKHIFVDRLIAVPAR